MKNKIKKPENTRLLIVMAFITLTGIMGCQSAEIKSTASNRPPVVVSAEFFPAIFKQDHSLVVNAHSKDPENDAVSYRYTWFVNQQPVHHEQELPAHFLKRGRQVTVEIIPNDGFSDGAPFISDIATVQNTPPEIVSIQLLPQPFHPGKTIRAEVTGQDNEGDAIQYTYQWKKNGFPVFSDNRSEIIIDDLKKGDVITVKVTPHDGIEAGTPFESLNLSSQNRRPQIVSSPPFQFQNGVYTYPVIATDPDGDPLQYAILDPRPGMNFDPKTGHFQWEIPDEISGIQHVTLVVRDSEGEGAAQKVRLDIDFLRNNS
ncbi:MAG: hypothetical protein ACE5F7_00355 [Nitrospiria bacterium]